ncbi:hypothetical protein [Sphaerochaeta sp. PS]|uniref:hypothetical protein n=1 Tax=Sphaerochaeta sp. PS TaxID=3076336 RepID=UPI0028A4D330|nr:hypothetical protein [Sphaerochaeta sp. PS]MDT4762002.1 hypothetical protein [Sphaerochaeta sp. PS]
MERFRQEWFGPILFAGISLPSWVGGREKIRVGEAEGSSPSPRNELVRTDARSGFVLLAARVH